MDEELRTVYEAQKLDLKIAEQQKKMLLTPDWIENMEREVRELKEKVEQETLIVEELEKERRKKEKELETDKEKVKKFESRLYEVKTNKEYQALLKEIEVVKKTNDKTEEEILLAMEKIEELKNDFQSSSALLVEKSKGAEGEKKRLEAEMASVEQIVAKLKEERDRLLASVGDQLKSTYTILIERRGGLAIVEVKNDMCLGCFMNIPPQLYIEVTRNNRMILCPTCNRILYFPLDEA